MTVSALTEFCGIAPQTVTQLLNRVRDPDPLTNDLPESPKSFAGKELRPLTNDFPGRLFAPSEVCESVTEYYAFDARQYDGKPVAIANYRATAKAGMRLFFGPEWQPFENFAGTGFHGRNGQNNLRYETWVKHSAGANKMASAAPTPE